MLDRVARLVAAKNAEVIRFETRRAVALFAIFGEGDYCTLPIPIIS
jgi:hypothetical protein